MIKKKAAIAYILSIVCLFSLCSCTEQAKPVTPNNGYVYNPYNGKDFSEDLYNNYENGGIYGLVNGNGGNNNNNGYQNFGNSNNSQDQSSGNGNSSESNGGTVFVPVVTDAPFVKWESSKLTAPGDNYTLPNIAQTNGAPVIAELSKQVKPGDSITVMGEGFNSTGLKAYYVSAEGKTTEAKSKVVNDNQMLVTVKDTEEFGAYGVYVKNDVGTSKIKMVNIPLVWWISMTDVNAGDELSIYGENLATDYGSASNVYLIDGNNWFKMNVLSADPYKVTVQIPRGLTKDKTYTIKLHNGHGGETAWAESKEKITFKESKINAGTGKIINVADYGAKPDDTKNDDSLAIQKAINAADMEDTIYFPAGTYLMKNGVKVEKPLKFIGADSATTKIVMDSKASGQKESIFYCTAGPIEFAKLGFEDVRTTKFNNYFINYQGDGYLTGNYNLYIHNCRFIQLTTPIWRDEHHLIRISSATNVWLRNNYFESSGVISVNGLEKLIATYNEICGTAYCTDEHMVNQFLLWNTDKTDFSNNKVYGKDLVVDKDSGIIEYGDYISGRTVILQQDNSNFYAAHNSMERIGFPGSNAGEQILFEDIDNLYIGDVSSGTTDTVNLAGTPSENITTRAVVMITAGKGLGQYRKVKTYRDGKVTVDSAWDIVPDSTSKVIIFNSFANIAVYKNDINGFLNHPEQYNATCGVGLYGSMVNCFVTDNKFKNLPNGISFADHYMCDDKPKMSSGMYWVQIDYNEYINDSVGIRNILENVPNKSGKIPMYLSLGNTIRGNNFNGMIDYKDSSGMAGLGGVGIVMGTRNWRTNINKLNTWNGEWIQGTLIENNDFKDCEKHNILLCKHQGNTILRGNTVQGAITTLFEKEIPQQEDTFVVYDAILYEQD